MILFLLNLAGGVALLLFAVRQIQVGVQRGFMAPLRSWIHRTSNRRGAAAMSGLAAAAALQSATAVATLVAAFAGLGMIAPPAGLAIMLGADVGSAVAAQVLLSPLHALVPLFLVIGAPMFLAANDPRLRQAGRILAGLALVFLALGMIRDAAAPLRDGDLSQMVATYLDRDLLSAFALAVVLAWLMHSSIAAVLMVVTLASEGVLGAPAAAALVLGANAGGALIPVVLTWSARADVRQIMLGNLVTRASGALAALGALIVYPHLLDWLGGGPGRQAINLHLAFNMGVAVIGLLLLPVPLRVAGALVRETEGLAEHRASALDEHAMSHPDRALACAARETLRMGEEVVEMLAAVPELLERWDESLADRILRKEDRVDTMHFQIKLYIARLQRSQLNEQQSRRAMELVQIAANFEEAADLVATNLLEIARRLSTEGLDFSPAGRRDIDEFHDRVLSNAQLALNVLLTSEVEPARQLVAEKDLVRAEEQRLQKRHLKRLRKGKPESLETTNLHQEVLRALKQINSAFAYVGYPIVEEAGDLLASRLASQPAGMDRETEADEEE